MKKKLFMSMIAILILASMLAIPVANVQAWGWRPRARNKTYFVGTAWFPTTDDDEYDGLQPNPDPTNVIEKQIGDYILTKGLIVKFIHVWELFGEGINVNNPMNSLLKLDGSSVMWGRHVLKFCKVKLTGYFYGKVTPDGQLTVRYVSWGGVYKVIWRYEGNFMAGRLAVSSLRHKVIHHHSPFFYL